MIKFVAFSIAVLTCVQLLIGCRCPDVECPGGEEFLQTWTLVGPGSRIAYIDSTGARMTFTGTSRAVSAPHRNDGGRKNWAGCSTEGCLATGESSAEADGLPASAGGWSVTVKATLLTSHLGGLDPPNGLTTIFRILDWTSALHTGAALEPQRANDSMAYGLILGAHTYDTVLIQVADTTAAGQRVRHVYIARPGGIVGFSDGVSGRSYFLE